jgi:hypothetical protein
MYKLFFVCFWISLFKTLIEIKTKSGKLFIKRESILIVLAEILKNIEVSSKEELKINPN